MIKRAFMIISVLIPLALAGCGTGTGIQADTSHYPKDPKRIRQEKRGKLTGEGILLFGGNKEGSSDGVAAGIGVNGYLWRATLDTLSFMPLASADPFGGVIITDWYEDPTAPGERFKVNVVILDTKLRADGLRVSVFKQKRVKDGRGNLLWQDDLTSHSLAESLQDKILTRARELRVNRAL